MSAENVSQNNATSGPPSPPPGVVPPSKLGLPARILFVWVLPAIIVAAALLYAKYQYDTRPTAQRQKPPQQARLVTVETAAQVDYQTAVSVMGKVIPAKQITLSSEVPGRVVFVSPLVIPGGAIQQGQVLVRIDSRDYETVVKQRQSEVAKAELNLKLEQGNQLVAQQEYKMLNDIVQDEDRELVLRQPHLEEARAMLDAAQAALDKAKLDVERCTVKAPFNAVIQDKFVDVGAQVTTASSLMRLMGTDEYWVTVKVPVNELQWMTIPDSQQQEGSSAKIFDAAWDSDASRQGSVLRLLGQLEEQGRLAQVLVSVKDPLSLDSRSAGLPPVLVDSYVRVDIAGDKLENVFGIKRGYLHDGDNIWVMNDADQMEIRPVDVVFRDKQMVYLGGGLQVGDRIVTTDISAPVDGMLLRLNDAADDSTPTEEILQAANPEAQE